MVRGILIVAATVVLAGPGQATAGVGRVLFDTGRTPASPYDEPGYVLGYSWYECVSTATSTCPPNSERPTVIRLERGGQTLGQAGPGTLNKINVVPQPGDVVRVFVDGTERAAATWSGRPTIDDLCGRMGSASVRGLMDPGSTIRGSVNASVQGTPTYQGDSYTLTFPQALERGDLLQVEGNHAETMPSGDVLGVGVQREERCPVVPSEPAALTGRKSFKPLRVRPDGRLSLPGAKVSCPGEGNPCSAFGRVKRRTSTIGTLELQVPARSERTVRARLVARGMRLLRRRGRLRVKIDIFLRRDGARNRAGGGAYKVTLLRPR